FASCLPQTLKQLYHSGEDVKVYGRVYAADPYHHTLAPAPTYGVGAMLMRILIYYGDCSKMGDVKQNYRETSISNPKGSFI
ncbi:hypothetical protein STEG23_004130, partial [Scotinomys teguina]